MSKQLWINLPAADVKRSLDFFTQVGFTLNPQYDHTEQSASLLFGDPAVVIMLFKVESFEGFARHKSSDTTQGSEVLFSLGAESREEVDTLARKVVEAGGSLFAEPEEIGGWMYGCGFADLDGHRWNLLYLDMSKIPSS